MAESRLKAKKRELRESRAKYAVRRGKLVVKIDPAQLAHKAIILKRNGDAIGVVISLGEYREYKEWKKRREPEDDFPSEWYAEKAAFQKMLPELLKTHREKFVAVHERQVVDTDEKEGELIWRIEQKYGDAPVYIDEVLEKPRVYRIPSAWRVQR